MSGDVYIFDFKKSFKEFYKSKNQNYLYKDEFVWDMSSTAQDITLKDSVDEIIKILNISEKIIENYMEKIQFR